MGFFSDYENDHTGEMFYYAGLAGARADDLDAAENALMNWQHYARQKEQQVDALQEQVNQLMEVNQQWAERDQQWAESDKEWEEIAASWQVRHIENQTELAIYREIIRKHFGMESFEHPEDIMRAKSKGFLQFMQSKNLITEAQYQGEEPISKETMDRGIMHFRKVWHDFHRKKLQEERNMDDPYDPYKYCDKKPEDYYKPRK